MYITKIEPGKGKRYKVFGDDEFLFALYGKELKRYHILEHANIENDVVEAILRNVVYKRAKERALYLLEQRPLSVSMLKNKLKDNDYPSAIIDEVVAFLEKYHYLDDKEYISLYIETYSIKKSKKQMVYDLLQKGVSRDLIDGYFEDNDYSERGLCKKQMERYLRGKDIEDKIIRQKLFRYLYGKGFSSTLIQDLLDIMYKTI